MALTPEKEKLLECEKHILALGGPGSGKTYIALRKAEKEINAGKLKPGQRIIFLGFARATIARVAEQAIKLVAKDHRAALEMNTYHGFAWNIIRSHGYLLKTAKPIRLLPPHAASSRLSTIPAAAREAEKLRLLSDEGLLHFDFFARSASELLSKSKALNKIICDAYPLIILDEFQDTDPFEWQLIQTLGARSRLIALADADQRIYEFRGADPKRIGEFISKFKPEQFDFGSENNRSNGTDIAQFGNDLISGKNKNKKYKDVTVVKYPFRKAPLHHAYLKWFVIEACKRLRNSGKSDWSLAVLLPSKQLMMDVSDYLSEEQTYSKGKLPRLSHDVAVEAQGPFLAATVIAKLLEGGSDKVFIAEQMINSLRSHIQGRKGDKSPAQGKLDLLGALGDFVGVKKMAVKRKPHRIVVDECIRIAEHRLTLKFTGDPEQDWRQVQSLLGGSTCKEIKTIAEDAAYLRLLRKGASLRSKMSEAFRRDGDYRRASRLLDDALMQEHFASSTRKWNGIQVMNIHKSKGKEFDEVIIYEGSFQRILWSGANGNQKAQALLALRVAVTRAMKKTVILTPQKEPCPFL
jgi:DNA helicase-2/ATP-dependent DNA helicase PcrA